MSKINIEGIVRDIKGWCNLQWAHDNMLSYDSLEGALSF